MKKYTTTQLPFLFGILAFCFLSHAVGAKNDANWKQEHVYFEKVDLSCSSNTLDSVVISVQFWILPSGEIRRPAEKYPDHHVTLMDNGFVLSIDRLDDPDFGIYYCIVKTGSNSTDVIKVGINTDGPYYGKELIDRYKRNAIIGGIAAGVMLVVLITIWVLYSNLSCCKPTADEERVPPANHDPSNPAVQENSAVFENDKLDGWIQSTKIGESVYDSADALRPAKVADAPALLQEYIGRHDDRLLSTDSGHYQTIGSLERDQRLMTESEINDDVKILKSVIRRDWSETAESGSNNGTNGTTDVQENNNGNEKFENEEKSTVRENTFPNHENDKTNTLDEVEYSVSAKMRKNNDRKNDKEMVVIIDGDVIIEPNGTSVMVTTAPSINQTESVPRDNVVTKPDVAENTLNKLNVVVAPIVQKADTGMETDGHEPSPAASDIEKSNETSERSPKNGTETADKYDRKVSSTSSSKAEADSNPTSSVDDDTMSKFQNVLASLISKHSKNGSSVSGHSTGSRSSSADSNVFQEDELTTGSNSHVIQDVHL